MDRSVWQNAHKKRINAELFCAVDSFTETGIGPRETERQRRRERKGES